MLNYSVHLCYHLQLGHIMCYFNENYNTPKNVLQYQLLFKICMATCLVKDTQNYLILALLIRLPVTYLN